jgi:hypothetical protein
MLQPWFLNIMLLPNAWMVVVIGSDSYGTVVTMLMVMDMTMLFFMVRMAIIWMTMVMWLPMAMLVPMVMAKQNNHYNVDKQSKSWYRKIYRSPGGRGRKKAPSSMAAAKSRCKRKGAGDLKAARLSKRRRVHETEEEEDDDMPSVGDMASDDLLPVEEWRPKPQHTLLIEYTTSAGESAPSAPCVFTNFKWN